MSICLGAFCGLQVDCPGNVSAAFRETNNTETTMAIELNQTSRTTVNRFLLECNLSFAIALFSKVGLLPATSHCLQLYAVPTALIPVPAAIFGEFVQSLERGIVAGLCGSQLAIAFARGCLMSKDNAEMLCPEQFSNG